MRDAEGDRHAVPRGIEAMQSIDVSGLPEPVAQAIALMVDRLKQQFADEVKSPEIALPLWQGGIRGTLGREEIYDDRI